MNFPTDQPAHTLLRQAHDLVASSEVSLASPAGFPALRQFADTGPGSPTDTHTTPSTVSPHLIEQNQAFNPGQQNIFFPVPPSHILKSSWADEMDDIDSLQAEKERRKQVRKAKKELKKAQNAETVAAEPPTTKVGANPPTRNLAQPAGDYEDRDIADADVSEGEVVSEQASGAAPPNLITRDEMQTPDVSTLNPKTVPTRLTKALPVRSGPGSVASTSRSRCSPALSAVPSVASNSASQCSTPLLGPPSVIGSSVSSKSADSSTKKRKVQEPPPPKTKVKPTKRAKAGKAVDSKLALDNSTVLLTLPAELKETVRMVEIHDAITSNIQLVANDLINITSHAEGGKQWRIKCRNYEIAKRLDDVSLSIQGHTARLALYNSSGPVMFLAENLGGYTPWETC